ncbi:Rpn family recombination-promoting nuclease/putative transposase [Flavobacterium sp. JP2137]|uniref:Rpn family recombination-promoting nuclease/putative transposase n=1 Tax=Flavobacterium sp. JP2137 TaxID=3414510 RepID=UPI003D2FE6B6
MSRYVDLLTDFAFKKLFGTEPNKEVLMLFLDAVFGGKRELQDFVFDKTEYVGDNKETGSVIFDLTCMSVDGTKFIIEVQRSNQYNLKKRMLYYSSRLITDQAPKEERKQWNYNIPKICVIALLDRFVISDSKSGYFHEVCLCKRSNGDVFYDGLDFIYIELDYFNKEPASLASNLDCWLYIFKNISKLANVPHFLRGSVFEKIFDLAEFTKLTKREQQMYNSEVKRRRDNENTTFFAINEAKKVAIEEGREEGRVLGREEGREEGRVIGRDEGREVGRDEGREERTLEFTQNLIRATDCEDSKIAELCHVTLDYVKEVRSNLARE